MGALGWTIFFVLIHFRFLGLLCSYPVPLKCTDATRLCTSFIAFKPGSNQSFSIIQSMFDALQRDITVEGGESSYVYIQKNCSCLFSSREYLTNTTFTVRAQGGGPVREMVKEAYHGLAVIPNTTRVAGVGAVVSLHLLCGCSSSLWNYLMSYVVDESDSLQSLASRFGVSMDSIETLNGIDNPANITAGSLYYIPLNAVPGEPYEPMNSTFPSPVPSPSASGITPAEEVGESSPSSSSSNGWIFGGVGTGLAVLALLIAAFLYARMRRSSCWCFHNPKAVHKFRNRAPSFGRHFCYTPGDSQMVDGESSHRDTELPLSNPKDTLFGSEKPLIFSYSEVSSGTSGFSESNLLGHGTYGSVYYGILRDQEVAVKKMTASKTKEFVAEMTVLSTVHHANLVELVGYASEGEELFLVHEYAEKGSLSARLHEPQSRGRPPLSWVMRVQIALDAARGLEYLHEHAKLRYVHRDVRTSNILLNDAFRAKVSDFGLARLVGGTDCPGVPATGSPGMFGYLAPEVFTDGIATCKSDVYAFGVVLFEIISGREAVVHSGCERRSLVSLMVGALRRSPDLGKALDVRECADGSLRELYPRDCVLRMAVLARQCVDNDPILRPDMRLVVVSLSQILLSSVEWESTLAGNSQVFSGLVQGR